MQRHHVANILRLDVSVTAGTWKASPCLAIWFMYLFRELFGGGKIRESSFCCGASNITRNSCLFENFTYELQYIKLNGKKYSIMFTILSHEIHIFAHNIIFKFIINGKDFDTCTITVLITNLEQKILNSYTSIVP